MVPYAGARLPRDRVTTEDKQPEDSESIDHQGRTSRSSIGRRRLATMRSQPGM